MSNLSYYQGDNAKINDVYFHILDYNGERTPISKQTLNHESDTYFIIHGFTAGVGDKWLRGVDDFVSNRSDAACTAADCSDTAGTVDDFVNSGPGLTLGLVDSISDWKIGPDDYKQWEKLDSTQHSIGLAIKSYDPTANVIIVDWGNFSWGFTYDYSSLETLESNDSSLYKSRDKLLDRTIAAVRTGLDNFTLPIYYDEANKGTDMAARAINMYINQKSISPNKITLVGHSLGGHTAGKAGKLSDGQIQKIIAMDPAGPGFERYDKDYRLSFDDAKEVYALHTSESLGYNGPLGLYDLYINGFVEKSLFGGLDNDYVQPDTKIFSEISKHSSANHFTALMFAESTSTPQDKNSEKFLASHLYNPQINARFYDGALSGWLEALDITRNSYDPFTGLKLNIDNLLSQKYFSDKHFKWDFETESPFTDYAGFWYANHYGNSWWTQYQDDVVLLAASPDIHATTKTTPSWLAWWGPIDGGLAWLDQRNKKGELNFKHDRKEFQSVPSNGIFSIDINARKANNYTDTSYPIFIGLNDVGEEERISDPRQIIDFRDGLVIATSSAKKPMIDTITGVEYGLPLVGLPGSKLNIISTLKHLPVARWRDDVDFPGTENSYRFTPNFIDSSTPSLFRGVKDEFFDDNYNIYSFFLEKTSEDIRFNLNSMAYEYAFLSLVKTTDELLKSLGIDKTGWPSYVKAVDTPDSILTIYSMASAFSYIYLGLNDEKGAFDFNFDSANNKGFSPFSKSDVITLWDTILRTTPTLLGTQKKSLFKNNVPLDIDQVNDLIEDIPLEKIAAAYIKRTKSMRDMINDSYDIGGKQLIIPAIAGMKKASLDGGEDGFIKKSITDSYGSETINKYIKKQKHLMKNSVYTSNYADPSQTRADKNISINVSRQSASQALDMLTSGASAILNLKVNLSSPAPIFGLAVNYLLGGTAKYGRDYKILGTDGSTINFAPGTGELDVKLKLYKSFLGNSGIFQFQLLNSIAGYSVDDKKGGLEIIAKQNKLSSSKISEKDLHRSQKSVIIGSNGDDLLFMPQSGKSQNVLMNGGDGADIFDLSNNSSGIPYLKDFNPYEGDKIILNSKDFKGSKDFPYDNIDYFAGKLIYHGNDADTPSKVLALIGDGITDSNHFLSTIGIKKESYIEFL